MMSFPVGTGRSVGCLGCDVTSCWHSKIYRCFLMCNPFLQPLKEKKGTTIDLTPEEDGLLVTITQVARGVNITKDQIAKVGHVTSMCSILNSMIPM